jgi:hypothetical protein
MNRLTRQPITVETFVFLVYNFGLDVTRPSQPGVITLSCIDIPGSKVLRWEMEVREFHGYQTEGWPTWPCAPHSNGCWITIHGGHETILTEDIGTVDRTPRKRIFRMAILGLSWGDAGPEGRKFTKIPPNSSR